MAFDNVPWFVGGGAMHSPEVARTLAYAALRGNEGVIESADLRVLALNVPGAQVRVMPGACSILNRSPGGSNQAYVGRAYSETAVDISATGSGGGRSDLIVVRVEDPYVSGASWADPADPGAGPYVFPRVITNVPAGTRTAAQLGLGHSMIALARIDIPANTATVTQAMITDLRKVANPRRESGMVTVQWAAESTLTQAAYVTWPAGASYSIDVPAWATQVKIVATWAQVQNLTSNSTYGWIRAKFGSLYTATTTYDNVGGSAGSYRTNLICADKLTVPAAMRGTSQTITLEGMRQADRTGSLQMDAGSAVVIEYEFNEVPTV